MSKNAPDAANQQGSRRAHNELYATIDPSETTRRAPLSKKTIKAYFLGALHDGTFSSNKRFRISQKGTDVTKIGSWHPRKIRTLGKRMKI